jgi:hypothetical protein
MPTVSGTGNTITQYNVQTGAAGNLTNNVAPSATAGNPLVSAGSTSQPIFSATPTVTSITITNAPVATTDGVNKTYVDTAIAAVNPATSVVAATTANLNATYLNGASGIGATLTNAGSLAAFTIDGQTPTLGQRVLVKNQTSTFQNGVYTVTTLGTGIIAWVLTRAIDYDQPSDINSTGVINVLNGTVNALTGWLLNSTVNTVGTDPITYVQYSNAPVVVTQYDVLVGGAGNTINSVGPGTTGQILQSGGASANPAYSTATYPSTSGASGNILTSNGTNIVSTTLSAGQVGSTGTSFSASPMTQYEVVLGGATSDLLTQVSGTGTAAQVLTSNGAGAAPTWQAGGGGGAVLNKATGTLTNTQIKALSTTPVIIVAAQGAGTLIVPVSATLELIYGGSNVFSGATAQLFLTFSTTTAFNTLMCVAPNALIVSPSNFISYGTMGATTSDTSLSPASFAANAVNVGLAICSNAAITGNAANNNTINWTLYYLVAAAI